MPEDGDDAPQSAARAAVPAPIDTPDASTVVPPPWEQLRRDLRDVLIEEIRVAVPLPVYLALDGLSHLCFEWLAAHLFADTPYVGIMLTDINVMVLAILGIGFVAHVFLATAHVVVADWKRVFGEGEE